ncbi:hypothetical protein HNV12_14665 [Methanococcoides sp. SA1]|nr:hypothetical protein [Methanococcoides sp. SA1]
MSSNSTKKWFSALMCSLYLIFGIVQIAAGLGINVGTENSAIISSGIIGGAVLLIIGTIFLFGFKDLNSGSRDGVAYVYVGIIISLIFLTVYLLTMTASGISAYLLMSEDFEGWVPMDDMRPGLFLGIISLVGYILWKKDFPVLSGI